MKSASAEKQQPASDSKKTVKTEEAASTKIEEFPVALGSCQTSRSPQNYTYTCVLCQQTQVATVDETAFVVPAFVQQSTVLCQKGPQGATETTPLFLSSYLETSSYISSCNQVMHASCWVKHHDKLASVENGQTNQQYPNLNVKKYGFICEKPDCIFPHNTVMPFLPPLSNLGQATKSNQPDLSFDRWLEIFYSVIRCRKASEASDNVRSDGDCKYCKYISQQKSGL